MPNQWTEGGTMSNTQPPTHHHIRTATTDQAPTSGHKAPPHAILIIDGADRHGYLSAHRNAATMTGRPHKIATLKRAEYNHETGTVSPMVTTYWTAGKR